MFRRVKLPRQFPAEKDFGIKNLVVSGCSFTYNNSTEHLCAWPFYLRDLGSFESVFDTSLPGAGNSHISKSLRWDLMSSLLSADDTLIIVMWSGNDRDDFVCDNLCLNSYPVRYTYIEGVSSAISGGSATKSQGNVDFDWQLLQTKKSKQSRAIENYLEICSLRDFLDLQKYRYVFLNYLDTKLPSLTRDFNIIDYLPEAARQDYHNMFLDIETIYQWALKRDLLMNDDFHPTPDAHLGWTKQILIPALCKLNINESLT